jgi:phosphatidyl-myo-inositol alpha-mannosyltransferase
LTRAEGRPLRVGMVSYYLPSGSKMGIGYQAHELANALVARGNEVTVFSPSGLYAGARYRAERIDLSGAVRTFKFARRIREVDWDHFDVLHAHAGDFLLFGRREYVHVRTVHGSSLREAIHIRGVRERLVMTYFWLCELLATALSHEAVAVSQNTKRWMPWIRTVIPNGVDLSRFQPGDKSEHPSVLFVGTYMKRKRGKLLAEIFERDIRPQMPDCELWMVAEDAPTRSGVRVFGRVGDDQLSDLYRRAWIFCLPSTYEGFGIPYIEAMASGCPVVATPNAGAVEITEGGRYGVLAPDAELSLSLRRLLSSADERERLARAALEHVKQFDLARVAEEYEALYRRLLARAGFL